MKHGYIIEDVKDFEIGKYYAVVFCGKIVDRFLCANINSAAAHFLRYTERGCKITRFLSAEEAREIARNLQYEKSMYFDLFSHSKVGNNGQLSAMSELSEAIGELKELFIAKR